MFLISQAPSEGLGLWLRPSLSAGDRHCLEFFVWKPQEDPKYAGPAVGDCMGP